MKRAAMQLLKPAVPELAIERSRRYCRNLSRAQARNFYYGMKLLPEPRRSAMFAVYAYMRRLDDIADNDEGFSFDQRLEALNAWQERTHCALAGLMVEDDPLWPALADAVERYGIPADIFDEAIEGQRLDLQPRPFHNFEQLRDYCHRVAGVVGLASIHIWGYAGGEQTEALAIDRGIAF
jgi:phytoene synthase